MKTNADYTIILDILAGLERGTNTLTERQAHELLTLLRDTQGDYIPTEQEIQAHEADIARLESINFDMHPQAWRRVAHRITEFENKYC